MILLIEDEEILRFTFSAFLSAAGYNVKSAQDFTSALSFLSGGDPDLIVADIILKGQTGLDLLKYVHENGLNCPVVMITGKPSIATAAEAVRLGAYDYLTKPVNKETLLRVARQALKYKAILDENVRIDAEKERYRADLEAIFSSVQEGIVTVDTQMRVMKANRAFQHICGLASLDIIGRHFDQIPISCSQICQNTLKEVLQSQRAVRPHHAECHQTQQKHQMVVLTGSPLKGPNGSFSGAVLVIRDVTRENVLERELKQRRQFRGIIGRSGKMQDIYNLLEDLADSTTTVLITGESGTGKELAANALHYGGIRAAKPFVKINCSTLSDTLLESELFGHVQGAFTGAVKNKIGRFEMAHGGSILLDEIGDIPSSIQLKLLRVIQEKEFERVGDARPVKVDVRIIATTNRDLKDRIRLNLFREDLYYRLKVIEVRLPPLRKRIGDIPLLADHFRKTFNTRFHKHIEGVSENVNRLFSAYPWPGNVRELEHAVEHTFVLCRSHFIALEHLPREIREYSKSAEPDSCQEIISISSILAALAKTDGNKSKAARLLGISRRTIYRKLAKTEDHR